jgi:hypothetical protein
VSFKARLSAAYAIVVVWCFEANTKSLVENELSWGRRMAGLGLFIGGTRIIILSRNMRG